jgi:hypothetical protein
MKKINFVPIILLSLLNLSCSVFETMVNVSRLQFKIGKVEKFNLGNISIENKSKLNDFSPVDLLKLTTSFVKGELPVSFILNIQAKNPNDGTGGYPKTDAQIKSFPFKLFIDNRETITGNIDHSITVPGTGEITIIPVKINFDLIKFFKDKDYESLINLALNLGGSGGSSSLVTAYAQPTITTPLGDVTYPDELKIVSLNFSK